VTVPDGQVLLAVGRAPISVAGLTLNGATCPARHGFYAVSIGSGPVVSFDDTRTP
jgi:hypothetical protein